LTVETTDGHRVGKVLATRAHEDADGVASDGAES